jgi:hypothetical protein
MQRRGDELNMQAQRLTSRLARMSHKERTKWAESFICEGVADGTTQERIGIIIMKFSYIGYRRGLFEASTRRKR